VSKLRITYKKSMIGYSRDQKDTVLSLGLRKLGQSVVKPDNASVRGMIFKIKHLVEVEEIAENEVNQ
jgi:large subunit ribosomal protein L30